MATKKDEAKEESKEIAPVTGSTALADFGVDIYADVDLGNENVGQEDITIPRLKVAQALSPEIKKTKGEYIEGAEEGSVFNSATRELYDMPMTIVPVSYHRRYIEWVPREKGGGLVDPNHDETILDKCTRNDDGDYMLENGNEIVVTPEHFVIVVRSDGSFEQAVLSMSGSKAKISRSWNTAIRNVKIRNPATGRMVSPARFYMAYNLSTVPEANDRGDFFNWKITQRCPTPELPEVGPEVYMAARAFQELIASGAVKAEVEEQGGEKSSGETSEAF